MRTSRWSSLHVYLKCLGQQVVFKNHVCVPGVQMYVCNREHYGLLPVPLKAQQNVVDESESFIHTITEALSEYTHTHTHCPTVMTLLSFALWLILLSGLFLLLLDLDDPLWLHPVNSVCFIPPPPHRLPLPLSVSHPPLCSLFLPSLLFSLLSFQINPTVTIQRKSPS